MICVTSSGNTLESMVDPRFGRCLYFIFVDPGSMKFEAVENPNLTVLGGAGIQSAQMVVEKGVEAVITGNVGPNAYQVLQAGGVKVITGIGGTVKEAVENYRKGIFQPSSGPTVPLHFGTGPGMGMGRGRGMGGPFQRGMGFSHSGEPRGQWGGGGPGGGFPPQLTPQEELRILKTQAEMISRELKNIRKRIKELEEKK